MYVDGGELSLDDVEFFGNSASNVGVTRLDRLKFNIRPCAFKPNEAQKVGCFLQMNESIFKCPD